MGANRERLDVLLAAFGHLPYRLAVLAGRLVAGNPQLERWLSATRAAQRKPVIIVMIERLGDLIACSSIPRQLAEHDPSIAIAWVCSRRFSAVFLNNPYVDAVFDEESLAGWLLTKRRLSGSYDCRELFLDSQRCCWTGIRLPGRCSGVNHQNYLLTGANLLLSYSRAAGLSNICNVEPDLYVSSPAAPLPAELADRPLMAVHFYSEDPDRRISPDAAARFVNRAVARGWGVVEMGIRPIVPAGIAHVHFPGASLPLGGQLALMRQVAHFVGVDSAFLHVANAFRIPATLLLGKFRHFEAFETFGGSFFHSAACTIFRDDVPMARVGSEAIAGLVPDLPDRIPIRKLDRVADPEAA